MSQNFLHSITANLIGNGQYVSRDNQLKVSGSGVSHRSQIGLSEDWWTMAKPTSSPSREWLDSPTGKDTKEQRTKISINAAITPSQHHEDSNSRQSFDGQYVKDVGSKSGERKTKNKDVQKTNSIVNLHNTGSYTSTTCIHADNNAYIPELEANIRSSVAAHLKGESSVIHGSLFWNIFWVTYNVLTLVDKKVKKK